MTLGGTGKEIGDRHPKVADHVLIGCGASVLGNITVGVGAQVASGSLVLKPVDAHTLVAGSPAKFVRQVCGNPAALLEQSLTGPAGSEPAVRTATGAGVQPYKADEGKQLVDAERHLFSGAATVSPSRSEPQSPASSATAVEEAGQQTSEPAAVEMGSASTAQPAAPRKEPRRVAVAVASDTSAAAPSGSRRPGMVSLQQWRESVAAGEGVNNSRNSGVPIHTGSAGRDNTDADKEEADGPYEEVEDGELVAATECDDEAGLLWGERMREPEFFI